MKNMKDKFEIIIKNEIKEKFEKERIEKDKEIREIRKIREKMENEIKEFERERI
eukprot:jgi/Orpsp1_1/1175223/evm.model.c7180000053077.1